MKERFSLKKELRLTPAYIILTLWVIFTSILIGWIFLSSFATTKEIFKGVSVKLPTGFHFENYVKAWTNSNVSVFFFNSLGYSIVSTLLLVLVLFLGSEVLRAFTGSAGMQELTHIAGGVVGILLGLLFNRRRGRYE